MNYYASKSNNTAGTFSRRIATRLTSVAPDGTLEGFQITARILPPSPLREREQWVCWKYKQRGNNKTKPPIDPHTGDFASVSDSSTWADYETALQYCLQADMDGIGFVLTEEDPFAGIDWDDCRDPETGSLDDGVCDELKNLDSYSEVSPSGTGIHTLLYGSVPDGGSNQNEAQGIEIYDSRRYLTVTGDHLQCTPLTIEDRAERLAELHTNYIQDSSANASTSIQQPDPVGLEGVDEDEVAHAKSLLRDFYTDPETTQQAREYLTDLLNGHYKAQGFIAKDGTADTSEAETTLATLLFGIFHQHSSDDRALELVDMYITYACKQTRYTADGQPRKWLWSENHRRMALENASQNFDSRIWKRWQRKKENWETWSDDYSDLTYERVSQAVFALADPNFQEYPTKREVIEFAQEIDPSRAPRTHETALHKLRDEREQIKMAYLGGNDYVYYPVDLPDPADSNWVKIGGEKQPPSSA